MRKSTRAALGIGMWLVIYFFAVYLAPFIGFIHAFVQTHTWLSTGEISQAVFLIISLVLISAFTKGDMAAYGLRWVKLGRLIKPVAMGIGASVLFFVLSGILMVIIGPVAEGLRGPFVGKRLLNFVLTIVVLASTCEEIFYRGLIQGFLSPLKDDGFKLFKAHISVPVTICALGFGFGHLCLLSSMPIGVVVSIIASATVLGFIAGYYREQTGSLMPAIAVHMTFNVVSGVIPMVLMREMPG